MESHHERIIVEDFDYPNWDLDCFFFEDNDLSIVNGGFTFSSHSDSTLPWLTLPLSHSFPSSDTPIRIEPTLSSTLNSKANREKMRRTRLNERFLELCTTLYPVKTPKLDKATILTDAIRTVNLLQEQTSRLKDQNKELKDKIKELKAEKKELQNEKHMIKVEKENIERRIKALGTYYYDHHVYTNSIPYQAVAKKMMSFVNQGVVSTSQDHFLHPPAA